MIDIGLYSIKRQYYRSKEGRRSVSMYELELKTFQEAICLTTQGSVVRRVDNFIQRINPYPVDKIGAFLILIGQRANLIHWIKLSRLFVQPGPGTYTLGRYL